MSFTLESVEQMKFLLEEGERISADARIKGESFCFIPSAVPSRNPQRCVIESDNSRVEIAEFKIGIPLKMIDFSIRPKPEFLVKDGNFLLIPTRSLYVTYSPRNNRYGIKGATKTELLNLDRGAKHTVPGSISIFLDLRDQIIFQVLQGATNIGEAIEQTSGKYTELSISPIVNRPFIEVVNGGVLVPLSRYDLGFTRNVSVERYPILPPAA